MYLDFCFSCVYDNAVPFLELRMVRLLGIAKMNGKDFNIVWDAHSAV